MRDNKALPAPIWEVFHPADGLPIGHTAAWHWLEAIEAVALASARDSRLLDAELVPLEMTGEPLHAGVVRLVKRTP